MRAFDDMLEKNNKNKKTATKTTTKQKTREPPAVVHK